MTHVWKNWIERHFHSLREKVGDISKTISWNIRTRALLVLDLGVGVDTLLILNKGIGGVSWELGGTWPTFICIRVVIYKWGCSHAKVGLFPLCILLHEQIIILSSYRDDNGFCPIRIYSVDIDRGSRRRFPPIFFWNEKNRRPQVPRHAHLWLP